MLTPEQRKFGMQFLKRLDDRRAERGAIIAACRHENGRGVGLGYALCNDCGALLPDEDPDLRSKCNLPER